MTTKTIRISRGHGRLSKAMTMRNPKWILKNTILVHKLNLVAHCIIVYMEAFCSGLVVSMYISRGSVTCCDAHIIPLHWEIHCRVNIPHQESICPRNKQMICGLWLIYLHAMSGCKELMQGQVNPNI